MNTEQYDWQAPQSTAAPPLRCSRRADVALVALLVVALSVLAAGLTVRLRDSTGATDGGQPVITMLDSPAAAVGS